MLTVFGRHWRPYHSQAELEESFKRNCLRPSKDEEEKIKHIKETIYEHFIKFHLGMGFSTLSYLSDRPRYIFEQGELQNEWIDYSKKFAGVIEALYRILKGDEAVEEYVEKELERTYRILSDGDTSGIWPVTKSVFCKYIQNYCRT